jgi:hypothetical protein
MQKRSLKLYFATSIFTLLLASFSFAGNGQCPLTEPPPEGDGFTSAPVIANTNISVESTYQYLKGFWELFTQQTDLS